jgi:hypothetical protein
LCWGVGNELGAAVMEEMRPPPVVESWAATREAAARRVMCVNFMVRVWDVLVGLVVGVVTWLMVSYCECVIGNDGD